MENFLIFLIFIQFIIYYFLYQNKNLVNYDFTGEIYSLEITGILV